MSFSLLAGLGHGAMRPLQSASMARPSPAYFSTRAVEAVPRVDVVKCPTCKHQKECDDRLERSINDIHFALRKTLRDYPWWEVTTDMSAAIKRAGCEPNKKLARQIADIRAKNFAPAQQFLKDDE